MLPDGLVEQDLGPVVVGAPEEVDGHPLHPGRRRKPARRRRRRPGRASQRIGPLLETHRAFRTGRTSRSRAGSTRDTIEARVWERGVGETGRLGTSAIAVAAAFGVGDATIRFPGGDLHVRIADGRALLTGPAEQRELSFHRRCAVYSLEAWISLGMGWRW